MSNEVMIRAGVYLPKDTLRQIDQRRGRYLSRNKYLLKILEEHWNEEDQLTKNVQGPKGTTPPAQAPPRTPTSTSTESASTEADKFLRHMTTDEGSCIRLGGVDVYGK